MALFGSIPLREKPQISRRTARFINQPGAHFIRILQTSIAEYMWYFSAASASIDSSSKHSSVTSGWGMRYIYWNRRSSVDDRSERVTTSSLVAKVPSGNTSERLVKVVLWTLNRTPSEDDIVTSESGALTDEYVISLQSTT